MDRLAKADLSFYVMSKDGEYCGASLWDRPRVGAPAAQFAVCAGDGRSRRENCVYLLERKEYWWKESPMCAKFRARFVRMSFCLGAVFLMRQNQMCSSKAGRA